jgi:acyl-CoA synthetase (AMP-forming)/AMP-acid ligase II
MNKTSASRLPRSPSTSSPERHATATKWPCCAESGEQLTYRQLIDQTAAVAGELAAAGVRPGDTVAIISHNQPRYAVALPGAMAAGATVTPINPALTSGEITKILTASRASVVIAAAEAPPSGSEVSTRRSRGSGVPSMPPGPPRPTAPH